MLGNIESTIYAVSTNKWPQMWPQKQIEWATGNHYSIRETDFENALATRVLPNVCPKPNGGCYCSPAPLYDATTAHPPVVSGNSICIDLQGIADRARTAGDPVIMLLSS
jgi:hypothetical protein